MGSRVVWGPLGWQTLHSVAILYPDQPTRDDRKIAEEWLKSFTETIACDLCKANFVRSLAFLRRKFDIFQSRHSFFWFSLKAHNAANAELKRPPLVSYKQGYEGFRAINKSDKRKEYRAYLAHLYANVFQTNYIVRRQFMRGLFKHEPTFESWFQATNWENNTITATWGSDAEEDVLVASPPIGPTKLWFLPY